ncbi:putative photosynthetic complex assembly protein 2 [Roseovarius sp. MBR-78]|uniref:putative photosynthetic complex assembly protein PuhE n=1 Tax=Roseovarius sp. MBR-78 TaxID=3156460 RepID=UPI0033991320
MKEQDVHSPWIAAFAALFLWWFSTGAILVVVRLMERRGEAARRAVVVAALPVMGLGIWGYETTLGAGSAGAAYGAFLSALAIWGWIELAFLLGVITGPNAHACPADVPEWERFVRAWGTLAFHEILLVAVLGLMWATGAGAANPTGLWTFTMLYAARVSAKLNLYAGVPRINVEFIPAHLRHMASHFRLRRPGWVFAVAVTGLTLALACWIERAIAAGDAGALTGHALLAAITGLALLEHWLMVLPLPDAKLWRWMMPAPKQDKRPEGPHGF